MNKSKQQPSNSMNKSAPKNSSSKMVSAPIAKAKIDKISKPRFSMAKSLTDGRVSIRHKEFINDISGSVLFASNSYSINPGLALTFPWLNTVSIGYESYRFKRLSFSFESSKSASTNGSVMMAVDFDPSDTAPTTKAQLLAYNNAIRGPCWDTFTYVCSPQDLHKFNQKFIRYGNLITGQDAQLFDAGIFYICTSGFIDSTVIGELHVDYEVELITPQFDLTAYALSTAAKAVAVGTVTNANWLGDSITSTGGVGLSYAKPSLIIQIPGQYLLTYTVSGVGLAQAGSPTFSSTGNTLVLLSSTISTTAITYVVSAQIDVPYNGITVSSLTTAATSFSGATLRIGYYAVSLA